MKLGISTYALFWHASQGRLSLVEMAREAVRLGADSFQICDYEPLEGMDADERLEVREAGIELELGTRGVHPDHLRRYLGYCRELDARVLRTMIPGGDVERAAGWIRSVLPDLGDVSLAIENYEQVHTADLLRVIEEVGDPRVGACLDPANSVAALELPADVIARLAPHALNVHVKDFAFSRRDGWVGFTLAGTPLGEGLLDLGALLGAVPDDVSAVLEFWLPFAGSLAETLELERAWLETSVARLRAEPALEQRERAVSF